MPDIVNDKIAYFQTPQEFDEWLKNHHNSETEIWIKIFKKASKIQSITWSESVLVSLCWGWIDGVKKSFDDKAYLQRFTPRRKNSNWSKRNCEHVENLIKKGLMKEPGIKHVQAAKSDGRWDSAYAPVSELDITSDFLEALESNITAKEFFEKLNKTSKYVISHSLETAKKTETRTRRLNKFIEMLENNIKPK